MTKDEEKLEEARGRIHKRGATDKDRADFKALSKTVAEARTAERLEREAAGPPEVAPGDAVVRPGVAT